MRSPAACGLVIASGMLLFDRASSRGKAALKITFECFVTAYRTSSDSRALDTAACRAAGLDGFEHDGAPMAAWLDDPLIADAGLIDAGMRFWLDASEALRGAVAFRLPVALDAGQLAVLKESVAAQLRDGAGEDQIVETRAGAFRLDWLHRQGQHDRTITTEQIDDGVAVVDRRPPASLRAAETGDVEALRSALDSGAAVDARGRFQMTALMLAAREGHEPCVELLLTRGASADLVSESGSTAIALACMTGHGAIVTRLLVVGADASLGDKPALHWAANREHLDVCRILLGAGVDANARDGEGETALFFATDPEIIRLLIDRGASAQLKNGRGQTALDNAREQLAFAEDLPSGDVFAVRWRSAVAELRRHAK